MSPARDQSSALRMYSRRVMEAGLAGDLGVVQQRRIEADWLSLGQPPKKLTVPPRRTMLTAHCQVSGLPTASMAISTPRPLVRSRTVCTTDRVSVLVFRSARRRPWRRRGPAGSAAADRDHARSRRAWPVRTNISPMGPRPMIATCIARARRASLPSRAARRPAVRSGRHPDSRHAPGIT